MENQFQIFIQSILADKYDVLPEADIQFNPNAESEEEILRSVNIAFLYLLAGEKHHKYEQAKRYLDALNKHKEYAKIAEFYTTGINLVINEIGKISEKNKDFTEKIKNLNKINFDTHSYKQISEHFWNLFFPEAEDLLKPELRKEKIQELRETRKIKITATNPEPVANPAKEILFTSNALLTIPLNSDYNNLDISINLKQHLRNMMDEEQKYWYDHPIPIGTEPGKNEVLYGLSGLSEMLEFEKSRGNAESKEKLDCLLSVSVTHSGLHKIAKEYLNNEIYNSNNINKLNIYIFTENETQKITNEIIIPIAKKYLDVYKKVINTYNG